MYFYFKFLIHKILNENVVTCLHLLFCLATQTKQSIFRLLNWDRHIDRQRMDGHINTVNKSTVHQTENYSDYSETIISNLFIHKHSFHMVLKITISSHWQLKDLNKMIHKKYWIYINKNIHWWIFRDISYFQKER